MRFAVYLSFIVRLGEMTLQDLMPNDEEKTRAMHFFGTSNIEKVRCCKAALAAACVAHNVAQGIDGRFVKPELFEGGVWAPGNISTSQ